MTNEVETRLAEMSVTLPEVPAPAGNYVAYVQSGNMVYVSGQISKGDNGLITGKLGAGMSVEEGYAAAQVCALNLIAQVKLACGGDLSRVTRVVRLGGFVNATDDFEQHPQVINGASDLIAQAFGEKAGPHARAAVGCSSLPLGVAVEVEGTFEIA